MKHNWTRPIVKFIEDDIVASGIGGATGPARFFAARGAGLVGDGVNKTFGSGDTRTWSAWDNMFVTTGKYSQKRRRIIPVKRRFRRPMYRRRLTMRRTRRRMYRKKATWGTRVRRAALKSAESKRHQVTTTSETINDQTFDTTAIARVPDLDTSATQGLLSKIHRLGTTIVGTGFASHVHLRNNCTQPMMVKCIWYYKTRDVYDFQGIFRNTQFEEVEAVSSPSTYFARMIQTIGNRNTVILKTVTVNLSEKGEPNDGRDAASFKTWIPFKKVIRFNVNNEGTTQQEYDVHFGIVPFNREGIAFTTSGSGNGSADVLTAQHRHVLYFKDP